MLRFVVIFVCIQILSGQKGSVLFFTERKVEMLKVPIAKYPIFSWIELEEGIYPNSTAISGEVELGKPVSVLIYFNDRSHLYDVMVNTCHAIDSSDGSKEIVALYSDKSDFYNKIAFWSKEIDSKTRTTLLHANFPAFAFPDKNSVNITCNIQVCYQHCNLSLSNSNKISDSFKRT